MTLRFKFINTGSTRLVFLLGSYAIKIPRCFVQPDNSFYGQLLGFLWGWEANRVEYVWSKSKIYNYLNPVRLSLFWSLIVIQDRVEEITIDEFINLPKFNFGSYEHKIDSFGKVNNKIVIIDYGN